MLSLKMRCTPGVVLRNTSRPAPFTSASSNAKIAKPLGTRLSLRQQRAPASFVVRAEDDDDEYDPEMDCDERMEKTMLACQKELLGIRTGRAQPAMLSTIEVTYYGAPTPLQSLATVTTPDGQTLMINPFDKASINDIEAAINVSGLGLTPNNDGKVIRINIPALTEDRRKEMAKMCAKVGEEAKVACRMVRRDALKRAEKLDLPEDSKKAMETDVQKITDSYIKKVDDIIASKTKELTTV